MRAVPQEAWETAQLKPIEAFRLLAFDYPVSHYLGRGRRKSRSPAREETHLGCGLPPQLSLRRMDLTQPAYELLSSLASGQTVGDSIVSVMTRKKQLFAWFRDWMAEGLFHAVELAADERG